MGQRFKRLELHNHTTESDASISVPELIELMSEDGVDGFALTDHNTISGHPKAASYLAEHGSETACIYGMEYTTYYGHILCLNLKEYVPWENINVHKPELLFRAVKDKGAIAGIAHPFSFGHPFARGCRFDMRVTDYSVVDFIEIFNNPEPLHEVNERGELLWEELVLGGEHLAATCGMDLHGRMSMAGQYATFIEGRNGGDIAEELAEAVRRERTWVSKGALLTWTKEEDYVFEIIWTDKPGYPQDNAGQYVLVLEHTHGRTVMPFGSDGVLRIGAGGLCGDPVWIPKLYRGEAIIENLICVSPVIRV